jgi:type I restriction enzyme M protein
MNMIIHDDGHTNIINADGLDFLEHIEKKHNKFKPNSFDLIFTNPPFGASLKISEKENGYLEQYQLGKNRKNQKTEILFIERCISYLKPTTGKMAIVLPDSILSNSSLQYVRTLLLQKCELLGIISLPATAFTHYGAGVKSSVLFVRRKAQNEINDGENHNVFMANVKNIGYDAAGKEAQDDLPEVLKKYENFEKNRNILSDTDVFTVNINDIYDKRFDVFYHLADFQNTTTKINASKYDVVPLKECLEYYKKGIEVGSNSYIIGSDGVPFVRVSDIDNQGIYPETCTKRISYDLYESLKPEYQPEIGEILYTKDASVGFCCLLIEKKECIISSGIVRMKVKNGINNQYLQAVLTSQMLQDLAQRACIGSVIKHLNIDSLLNLPIPLPPLEIQNRIAQNIEQKQTEAQSFRNKAMTLENEAKNLITNEIF